MFGRANNPSWLLGVAAAAAVTLALPSSGGAHGPNRVARLRAEDASLEAKTRSSVLLLYALDARLGAAQASLATLEWRAGRLEAQQRAIRFELRLAELDSRLSEERAASRLRYLYDYGTNTSSLEIVLGSSSISQALNRLDDANEVAAANAEVIAQLHASEDRLSALSHALGAERLRLAQTAAQLTATVTTLGQARTQRSSYISTLERTRADNAAQIATLDAQAQAAEARAQALMRARAVTTPQPSTVSAAVSSVGGGAAVTPTGFASAVATPAAPSAPSPAASLGSHTITVVATGYALGGRTSTGIPVGYGVVAVDPSVIPLGSHMTVPGYGYAVAADTGGAIVGDRIDLWFPTMADADAWGVRTVTIVVDS